MSRDTRQAREAGAVIDTEVTLPCTLRGTSREIFRSRSRN